MASQVLSGASNPSYTNNTGQNVRIVINYMSGTANGGIVLNWAGVSVSALLAAIGRNLATSYIDIVDPPNNAYVTAFGDDRQYPGAAAYPGYGVASNNNALARTVGTPETYVTGESFVRPTTLSGTKTTGS